MKKIVLSLLIVSMLVLSSCDFGGFSGGEEINVTLTELIESEILAEADVDIAIEEDIEISIPLSFSKTAPGPNFSQSRRRVNLRLKHKINSVYVDHAIEYISDDTALVTFTKTLIGTMYIRHTDTTITDTPVVWEKSYEYTTISYLQCLLDSSGDSTQWKLLAKSIESGATAGILNTIESVTIFGDNDSDQTIFDDPTTLYEVVRGFTGNRGHFRGRPGDLVTSIFVLIDGNDDVNVLGSSGRHFALKDDGEGIDLTADDNIYSGTLLKGRGQSRLRVRMITTATFIEEDAPVEIASWILPVR